MSRLADSNTSSRLIALRDRIMRRLGYYRRPAVEWLMRRSYQRGRDEMYVELFLRELGELEEQDRGARS